MPRLGSAIVEKKLTDPARPPVTILRSDVTDADGATVKLFVAADAALVDSIPLYGPRYHRLKRRAGTTGGRRDGGSKTWRWRSVSASS